MIRWTEWRGPSPITEQEGDGYTVVPEGELWPCGYCGAAVLPLHAAYIGRVRGDLLEAYCAPICRELDPRAHRPRTPTRRARR